MFLTAAVLCILETRVQVGLLNYWDCVLLTTVTTGFGDYYPVGYLGVVFTKSQMLD